MPLAKSILRELQALRKIAPLSTPSFDFGDRDRATERAGDHGRPARAIGTRGRSPIWMR